MVSESKYTPELLQKGLIRERSAMNLKLNTRAAKEVSRGRSGTGIYANYLDKKVFGVYRWLPEMKLGLVAEKEYYGAMLEAGVGTFYKTAAASGIVFILFIIFAVIYSRRLSEPLERLAVEVNQIAEGSFRTVINLQANKEVEELVQAVNRMSSNFFHNTMELNKDIEELELSREKLNLEKNKLSRMSITDELTGLYNRRHLNHELSRQILLCGSLGKPVSVMMLDLDHFKVVNDTFGHATGDVVLKELAEIMKGCTGSTDVVGRFGGEEFMVIVPFIGAETVRQVAERIRQEVENFVFDRCKSKVRITVSIGIATLQPEGDVKEQEWAGKLLEFADR